MTKDQAVFDKQYQVFAGKLRRYNGESWLTRILDIKTNLLNLRDLFYVLFGVIESWFLLRKLRPDVILLKGGFVGVPIGLAARSRFPIVTHDSDALPGLANRLVSRWAIIHATGMPASYYQYPAAKMRYIGVIVSEAYKQVTPALKQSYRQEIGLPTESPVLMITGGSNGAQTINKQVAEFAPGLLDKLPTLQIIHQVGNGNETIYGDYSNDRLKVYGLLANFQQYSGSADVIVTRAGANTIAEFGIQAKACIVVPNGLLTGGHQLKNADYLVQNKAAIIVEEGVDGALLSAVEALLADDSEQKRLGDSLHSLTKPHAAQALADILREVAGQGN